MMAKKILPALAIAGLVAGPAAAQSPSASSLHPVCLWTQQIAGTTIVDPSTILFHTNDGRTYVNHLKGPCPGLKFHGFVYLTQSSTICSNAVPISVIETHETCALGVFEPVPGAKPPSYAP